MIYLLIGVSVSHQHNFVEPRHYTLEWHVYNSIPYELSLNVQSYHATQAL